MEIIGTSEFLNRAQDTPVIDVRSPAEYGKGHIPGAHNLPVFENEERAVIGTLYTHKGKEEAIRKGLELVGPKMTAMVDQAAELSRQGALLVHCWRGGMRSSSVAWLLETTGLQVHVLDGGYKSYRRYIREEGAKPLSLLVLGGLTGSGKTRLLRELGAAGESIIDLELLANHRGSVFGGAGLASQPTTEQFENNLFARMYQLPHSKRVWVEDESKRIGSVYQPDHFYKLLREASLVFIELSDEERQSELVAEYAELPPEQLDQAIVRLQKRLGGLVTTSARKALAEKKYQQVAAQLLPYYDKLYLRGLEKRNQKQIYPINLNLLSTNERIEALVKFRESIE